MPKLFRFQDRYPVSRSTRSRWLKDPLLPEPDLIAGGVCYFAPEKLDLFDRLRTERERAKRTTVKPKEEPAELEPPPAAARPKHAARAHAATPGPSAVHRRCRTRPSA